MANTILFRGAFLRSILIHNPPSGEKYVSVNVTADYTTPVAEKMDWGEVPECVTGAKLKGKLLSTNLILTPADKELKKFELDLDIRTVDAFEVVCMKDEEGETTHREMRFRVESGAKDAGALLEHYVAKLGRNKGAMKVSYTKQEELPLEESAQGELSAEDE